jgi:hypothetical protein
MAESHRRTAAPHPDPARQRKQRLQALRSKLHSERIAWKRWMSRLTRAFHTIEKLTKRIDRLERAIRTLTQS